MGRRVQSPPVTHRQYLAGLNEGRDLYAEDLARLARRGLRMQRTLFGLALVVGMLIGLIVIGTIALLR